jgi:hypothetical protein
MSIGGGASSTAPADMMSAAVGASRGKFSAANSSLGDGLNYCLERRATLLRFDAPLVVSGRPKTKGKPRCLGFWSS